MRYFANELADFFPGNRVIIDQELWKQKVYQVTKSIASHFAPTFDNCDGGLYVGCAGVAYMYYYLAQSPKLGDFRQEFLTKARNYVDVSLSYAMSKRHRDPPAAFLLGSGGAYAVASLLYSAIGEKKNCDEMNKKYLALAALCQPVNYLDCGSDELFVGRAGYLAGAYLLNRAFGEV